MDSVVLVGGCGFLGLHLIQEFYEVTPRPQIHVFDVRPLPDVTGFKFDKSDVTVHIGDLTKQEDVEKVLKAVKPKVVVHSASPVHGLGEEVYAKVNVDGTKTLLKACESCGVSNLVYTSSAGVVFNGDDLYGVDEECPFPYRAMDAYNLTKQQAEQAVLRANSGKLRTVALRPAGIFGPGDRQMIPNLRLMAERGQNKIQLGDNNNLFDVTYAGNVAYSHVLAAQKLLAGAPGVAGEAFFITNDDPIYFWSFARQIWKHDGLLPSSKFIIPKKAGVVLGYLSQWACALIGKEPSFTAFRVRTACATRYYDISKAKKRLEYKPKWTLEQALNETLSRV